LFFASVISVQGLVKELLAQVRTLTSQKGRGSNPLETIF
jgi:hypothetical protein